MSDGKNAFKLPGDYIDFNLNLKIIPSAFFDAQKIFYTKKKKKKKKLTGKFFFFGLLCSVRYFRPTRNTVGQENRNYELRVSFYNSSICWKKTNNWGFYTKHRSFEHNKRLR